MAADIRVSTTFFGHPKIKRLAKRLGPDALLALLRLWCWVAENRQQGRLDGMDVEAIELAADWDGEPGAFTQTLIDLRLLDQVGDTFAVHDWETHNPWVYRAPERSEAAKAAAKARWDKRLGISEKTHKNDADSMRSACGVHAERMRSACDEHAPSIIEQCAIDADITNPQCPSPAPSPSPSPAPSPFLSVPSPNQTHMLGAQARARASWAGQVNQAVAERWDEFRQAYPWRNRIEEAAQVWCDTIRDGAEADMVLAALAEQKTRHRELQDAGHWVPQWRSAKNWIAGRGWEDEPLQPSLTKRHSAQQNKRSQLDKNRDAIATWADD